MRNSLNFPLRLGERTAFRRLVSLDVPVDEDTMLGLLEDYRAYRDQALREDREYLDALLVRLPPRMKRVLLAYYEDDRTLDEIGAMEGLTHERVRQ